MAFRLCRFVFNIFVLFFLAFFLEVKKGIARSQYYWFPVRFGLGVYISSSSKYRDLGDVIIHSVRLSRRARYSSVDIFYPPSCFKN
jgi:hypothetical protein